MKTNITQYVPQVRSSTTKLNVCIRSKQHNINVLYTFNMTKQDKR